MKVPFYMLLLLIATGSTSCKITPSLTTATSTEETVPEKEVEGAIVLTEAAYKKSLAIFEAGKKEYNNSYTFAVSNESWVGFWSKLFYTVKNGKIVARKLQEGDREKNPEGTIKWEENEKTIGSHKHYKSVVTMDTIYQQAKEYVGKAKKQQGNDLRFGQTNYVSMNDQGLISTIGFVPNNCADDCFNGYSISDFEWTK